MVPEMAIAAPHESVNAILSVVPESNEAGLMEQHCRRVLIRIRFSQILPRPVSAGTVRGEIGVQMAIAPYNIRVEFGVIHGR
jgi:hypothetical protein